MCTYLTLIVYYLCSSFKDFFSFLVVQEKWKTLCNNIYKFCECSDTTEK